MPRPYHSSSHLESELQLGSDFLSQLAGKAGVSPDAASAQLSNFLPDVIDKATPNGKIEAGGIDQLLKMFQGKMEG